MCLVKKPSIQQSDPTAQNKPLPIIRNPILDGLLGNIASTRAGTSAFRIDLVNPLTIPAGGAGAGLGGGGASGGSGAGGGSSGSSGGGGGGRSGGSDGGVFNSGGFRTGSSRVGSFN